jgi:hypothetical protein
LTGLRAYLLQTRRDTLLRQFCRKLLGYSLGRQVQLSDEPLLAAMQQQLTKNGYRFSVATDLVVRSPQFREKRTDNEAQVATSRNHVPFVETN